MLPRLNDPENLCAQLSKKEGLALFLADKEWRDSLTVSDLNDADSTGRNALMLIAATEQGRALINEDESFRHKITPQGFCLRIRQRSAVNYFLRSKDGLTILARHTGLRGMLLPECLNIIHSDDFLEDYNRAPGANEMPRSEAGIEVLEDPVVRGMLDEQAINKKFMANSMVFHLSKSARGIGLLADEIFQNKIHVDTINAISDHGFASVVLYLCQHEKGREILAASPQLRRKIRAEAFNAGASRGALPPVYYLAKALTGLMVLVTSKYLRGLIDADSMNAYARHGEDAGASLAFWLLSHPHGREILRSDKRLRDMIGVGTLRTLVTAGEHTGACGMDYLLMPENNDLLQMFSAPIQAAAKEWQVRPWRDVKPTELSGLSLFAREGAVALKPVTLVLDRPCVIL